MPGNVLGVTAPREKFHQSGAFRGDVGAPWSVARGTRSRIARLGRQPDRYGIFH